MNGFFTIHFEKLYTGILGLILLTYTCSVHAQSRNTFHHINEAISNLPDKARNDPNFQKAYSFLLEGEYDSTLLYAHNCLLHHKTGKYAPYCHYFRGISFRSKSMHAQARIELQMIPKNFELHYLVQMNLGSISLELGEYSESLRYLREVAKLPNTVVNNTDRSVVYHDIGVCLLHLEHYENAESYLLKSLALQEKQTVPDTVLIVGTYMDIANLYYVQYKDDLAIPAFLQAYQLSLKTQDFTLKQNAALNMAVVEENRGDFEASIQFRKEYERWKDSLTDQNKIYEEAQQEKKYLAEKKQQEIEILAKDNRLKQSRLNSFIISSVLFLLLAATFLYFYLTKRKANKLILAQKQELDILNDTKDRLFSVVSHDLRSNINALDDSNMKLTRLSETSEYQSYGAELQHNSELMGSTKTLLDNMLSWALLQTEQIYFEQENVSLSAIVNQVTHNYLPLMRGKHIELNVEVQKSIFLFVDLESIKVVLRNVLDNAIKHCEAGDSISLFTTLHPERQQCTLILEDTGTGIPPDVLKDLQADTKSSQNTITHRRTGLGLNLCQAMMLKNGGTLTIDSTENIGTRIQLQLPLSDTYE